jgi:hypothetical protein
VPVDTVVQFSSIDDGILRVWAHISATVHIPLLCTLDTRHAELESVEQDGPCSVTVKTDVSQNPWRLPKSNNFAVKT